MLLLNFINESLHNLHYGTKLYYKKIKREASFELPASLCQEFYEDKFCVVILCRFAVPFCMTDFSSAKLFAVFTFFFPLEKFCNAVKKFGNAL